MYVRIRHIMFERNHKQNSRKACKERALLLLALFYLNQYCRLMITNDTKSASLNYITMLQLPVKCFREMLQSSVLRSFCLPVGIDDCGHRRNDCTEEEKCFDVFCFCTFSVCVLKRFQKNSTFSAGHYVERNAQHALQVGSVLRGH